MTRRPPQPPPLDPIQARLQRLIDAYLRRILSIMLEHAPALEAALPGAPERMDSVRDLRHVIAGLRFQLGQLDAPDLQMLLPIAEDVARQNRRYLERDLRTATRGRAAQPRYAKRLETLDLFRSEKWLPKAAARWSAENAALISRLPDEMMNRSANVMLTGIQAGMRHETLAKHLQASLELPTWRSKLIARTSTAQWNAKLTEERHTRAGIRAFRWMTAGDRRVVGRPGGLYPRVSNPKVHGDHWERDGRVFLYERRGGRLVELLDNGKEQVTDYEDGIPGEPIGCRCVAGVYVPDLEDLLDEADQRLKQAG